MGLTGEPFLIIVCVLAVVVVVFAVRGLGAFPAHGPRDVAARSALVLATQAAVLLAVLVAVNTWGDFYASWSDLLGLDHSRGEVQARPQPVPTVTVTPLVAAAGHPRTVAGRGRIDVWHLAGPRSGLATTAYVVTPAEYWTRPAATFPAVLMLAAAPGRLAPRIDPEVFKAVYVVIAPPRGSCVDDPAGTQSETFVTQDVPEDLTYHPPIDAAGRPVHARPGPGQGYRIGARWGVIADRSAGYCGVKLAVDRSDRFVAAASLGTSYATPPGDLYGGSPAYLDENSLLWRLRGARIQPAVTLELANTGGQATALAAAARDPLRISLLPAATTLPAGLPAIQSWLAGAMIGRPPAATPALPTFRRHR